MKMCIFGRKESKMISSQKVDSYIEKNVAWSKELLQVRNIIKQTELVEEYKWSRPMYSISGKLVLGFSAFKNHIAMWFHQGVFLKDEHAKLMNAQEGKTKALRQWRIQKGEQFESEILLKYIEEAIQNSLEGKEMKPQPKKAIPIPLFLKEALKNDTELSEAFKKLTPSCQREYSEYIAEAKQEKTKISRLQKIIPMIHDKAGLHDKYKKN